MTETLSFSVLISVYIKENANYFRESLRSVFAQTLLPNEVIIVKDGPIGDDLEKVIQEFQAEFPKLIKVLTLFQNGGLALALNHGLKNASYSIVARMDSDDICHAQRFEKQIQEFSLDPDLDILGSAIYEFSDDVNCCYDIRVVPLNHNEIVKFAKKRCPFNHPSVMYKKDVILKLGGYTPASMFEDYPLWVKAIISGAKLKNLEEPLLYFRANESMYQRRGGRAYACTEFKMFKHFYFLGFITLLQFVRASTIRFIVRMIPNFLRKYFYRHILRKMITNTKINIK